MDNINFVGNIEGREIPQGKADVIVADGFVGNIVLKLIEGMGKPLLLLLKKKYQSLLLVKSELF